MNPRKLLAGLLLLGLLGILFSVGGLGSLQWSSGAVQPVEMAGSGTAGWGGGRDAYRSGDSRDGSAARNRDAYRQ